MTATTMIVMTTLTFFVKTILTKKLWFMKPEISLSAVKLGSPIFIKKITRFLLIKEIVLDGKNNLRSITVHLYITEAYQV